MSRADGYYWVRKRDETPSHPCIVEWCNDGGEGYWQFGDTCQEDTMFVVLSDKLEPPSGFEDTTPGGAAGL